MSRKKPNQSSQASKDKKRPDKRKPRPDYAPRESTRLKTTLICILAALVSAVVALQLASATGMLKAISKSEYLALVDQAARPARLQTEEKSAWDRFGAGLRSALAKDRHVKRHDAVNRLLTLLIEPPPGGDAATLEQQLTTLIEADENNFVTRLTAAIVQDRNRQAQGDAAPDASARHEAVRDVVGRSALSPRTRLYRKEFCSVWRLALEPFIQREDVRIGLSQRMPPQHLPTYNDHLESLPILCANLRQLSQALREEGRAAEADQCERWFTRLTLGLLEHEPDPSTQLLCARLLADAHESNAAVAEPLRKLIGDFHQHAESAPRDFTHPNNEPAINPDAYARAFKSFIIGATLCCVAAGCLVLLIFVTPFALIVGNPPTPDSDRTIPWYAKWGILLLPSLIVCGILVANANVTFYSVTWIIFVAAATLCLGAMFTVLGAGLFRKVETETFRRRMIIAAVLVLPLLVLLFLSPPTVTSIGRSSSGAVAVTALIIIALIACVAICPARLRTIASTAALAWCVNICAAFAVLQYHRWADSRHREAVVEARKDEFAARLGDDWGERYVTPVRDALQPKTP